VSKRTRKKKKPSAGLDFAEIESAGSPLTAAQIDALEAAHGPFPARYREFMLRLGPGEYRGSFFVYGPDDLLKKTTQNRAFVADNLDLWDNAGKVLSSTDVARLVFLAHTTAGQLGMLAFVGGAPRRILFIPRPRIGCVIEELAPSFAEAVVRFFQDED